MIKRSFNWLGNARADLSHLRSIESAGRSDFDDLFSGVFTSGSSYVIKGFTVSASIGAPATQSLLVVADSAIMHSASQTSGTILVTSASAPAQPLDSVTNSKVDGSFTPNSDNYIGLRYGRAVDDSTTDTVYFWDPTTQAEISKSVPLALLLDYEIVITNTTQSANILPIARIRTNSTNGITEIEDRRESLYRLGKGGVNPPNPAYVYPWPAGRNENPSTLVSGSNSPFVGGDKQLRSFKDWADAVMSMIKEIKGTTYWYSPVSSSGSIITISQDATKSVVTGTGVIAHSQSVAGQMNWTSDIFIQVIGSRLSYKILEYNSGSDITLSNEQAAYLNLQRDISTAVALTWTNASTAVTGAAPWTQNLMAGDFIKIAGSGDNEYYQIATIVDSQNVTLTTPFSGTSGIYDSKYAFGTYATSSTVIPSGPVTPTPERRIQIALKPSVPFDQNVWWLFYRTDSISPTALVYVHLNATQLSEGESTSISHGISQQTLDFIGAINDQDATPLYSTKPSTTTTTAGNEFLADNNSLTASLKVVDTELNQPLRLRASNPFNQILVFENSQVQSGDNANKVAPAIGGSVYFNKTGSVNFSAATPVAVGDVVLVNNPVAPNNGDYYVAGAYLDKSGDINLAFSAPDAVLANLQDEAVIGSLFPKSTVHIGYVFLQYVDGTDHWKSATASGNVIANQDIYRFGSGSGVGGEGGGEYNDDLISMLFRGKITDSFEEPNTSSESTVDGSLSATTAQYNANIEAYVVSYDASKTIAVGTTTTNILLSAAASFTVQIGDIVIWGGAARRITAVNSQSDFVTEAFPLAPTAASQVTVSQAVITKELYDFAGDGVSLSTTFGGATFSEFLIDYEDSSAPNDSIFDVASAPVVGWSASGDNTVWTTVGVRPTLQTSTAQSYFFEGGGSFAALYLRFFANKISGSGTVNLLTYRAYMQKDPTSTYGAQNSSIGYTDNSATSVNCVISVAGGRTRITLPYAYAVGVATGSPYGALDVYLNGQILPRFIAGSTPTAYYEEVNSNIIDLDQDYSSFTLEVLVIQRVTVTDTSTQNTINIAELQNRVGLFNGIVNGDFFIAQANPLGSNSHTLASLASTYLMDMVSYSAAGVTTKNWAIQQLSGTVPTVAQSGYSSFASYRAVATANNLTWVASDRLNVFQYRMEGSDYQAFHARTATIGFWFRATVTGTYSVALTNAARNRSYVTTFTVNAANTWEYKQILLTLDNTGTWEFALLMGLEINIGAFSGSTFQTSTLGSWQNGEFYTASTATNWLAATNNEILISQLSMTLGNYGLGATGFRLNSSSRAEELLKCQRYFHKTYDFTTAVGAAATTAGSLAYRCAISGAAQTIGSYAYKTTMRVAPLITVYSPTTGASGNFRNLSGGADIGGQATNIGDNSCHLETTAGASDGILVALHLTASARLL